MWIRIIYNYNINYDDDDNDLHNITMASKLSDSTEEVGYIKLQITEYHPLNGTSGTILIYSYSFSDKKKGRAIRQRN